MLSMPPNISVHLRLTAFGLGVLAFEPAAVALDVRARDAPFLRLARGGAILGGAGDGGPRRLRRRTPGPSAARTRPWGAHALLLLSGRLSEGRGGTMEIRTDLIWQTLQARTDLGDRMRRDLVRSLDSRAQIPAAQQSV